MLTRWRHLLGEFTSRRHDRKVIGTLRIYAGSAFTSASMPRRCRCWAVCLFASATSRISFYFHRPRSRASMPSGAMPDARATSFLQEAVSRQIAGAHTPAHAGYTDRYRHAAARQLAAFAHAYECAEDDTDDATRPLQVLHCFAPGFSACAYPARRRESMGDCLLERLASAISRDRQMPHTPAVIFGMMMWRDWFSWSLFRLRFRRALCACCRTGGAGSFRYGDFGFLRMRRCYFFECWPISDTLACCRIPECFLQALMMMAFNEARMRDDDAMMRATALRLLWWRALCRAHRAWHDAIK